MRGSSFNSRELFFNVAKHAETDRVADAHRDDEDDERVVVVNDPGRCFDPDQVQAEHQVGFGLVRLHERLDIVGGCEDVDATPGEGARATVRAPVDL